MLALKEKCLHPDSGQPYIKSASGGKDNSPEGKQVLLFQVLQTRRKNVADPQKNGITHAFVMLFTSLPDRDYYLFQDPVHQEFAESLGDLVENVQVVDYTSSAL